jgi:hypothetical protein
MLMNKIVVNPIIGNITRHSSLYFDGSRWLNSGNNPVTRMDSVSLPSIVSVRKLEMIEWDLIDQHFVRYRFL